MKDIDKSAIEDIEIEIKDGPRDPMWGGFGLAPLKTEGSRVSPDGVALFAVAHPVKPRPMRDWVTERLLDLAEWVKGASLYERGFYDG